MGDCNSFLPYGARSAPSAPIRVKAGLTGNASSRDESATSAQDTFTGQDPRRGSEPKARENKEAQGDREKMLKRRKKAVILRRTCPFVSKSDFLTPTLKL